MCFQSRVKALADAFNVEGKGDEDSRFLAQVTRCTMGIFTETGTLGGTQAFVEQYSICW